MKRNFWVILLLVIVSIMICSCSNAVAIIPTSNNNNVVNFSNFTVNTDNISLQRTYQALFM
jgi:hypothetical protein